MQIVERAGEVMLWLLSLALVIGLGVLYDKVIPGPKWLVVAAWVLSMIMLAVAIEMYTKRTGKKSILDKVLTWMELM